MNSKKNTLNSAAEWIIHALAWLIILGVPLYSPAPNRPIITYAQYLHYVLTTLSFMIIFYLDYFLFIKRFLFQKKFVAFFIENIIVIAILMFSLWLAAHEMLEPKIDIEPTFAMKVRFTLGNIFMYALVICVSIALRVTKEWFYTEANRKEIELKSLKSQINPHYLFNTLNNIYSLVQINTDKAQSAIHDLSQTLRYVIYESSKPNVSLASEIEFLKENISLMEMRLPSTVKVTTSFPEENEVSNFMIAPLLFLSPVENAFKHGVSASESSFIDIKIHIEENKSVSLICKNSNFPKNDNNRSGGGIGIKNLEKRLELIYPNRHKFIYGVKDNIFSLTLKIDL